tara:strand:- start:628 stop:1713 length:1086 start_codon:yes stop_codon:yes gene_type:complete
VNYIPNTFFPVGLKRPSSVKDLNENTDILFKLLDSCPEYKPTDLYNQKTLAENLGLNSVIIKDERKRFNLGSFKATGAIYAIAKMAYKRLESGDKVSLENLKNTLRDVTFATASAGNHGISMSVGAKLFGAKAIVFLSKNVPKAFANKLKAIGADVKFQGNDYEESMIIAEVDARKNNYVLLSDSTWETCQSGVDVMEGYMIIGNEVHNQLLQCNLDGITHVFLQAGVGGFAAALALSLRKFLREDIQVIVVEPTEAKTLFISLQNKKPSTAEGQASIMGRLDCKEPSWSAFYSLSKTSNYFMHLEDDYVNKKINTLGDFGISTTPSGGAGIAALMYAIEKKLFGINKDSSPLVFLTEDAI